MKITPSHALYTLLYVLLLLPVGAILADETFDIEPITSSSTLRFNNENWFTLPHPKIATFTMRDDGSSYGMTVTGVSFVQYNVDNAAGIRVQRFEMQEYYHYVIEGEIAYTLTEFSTKLALAYTEQLSTTLG